MFDSKYENKVVMFLFLIFLLLVTTLFVRSIIFPTTEKITQVYTSFEVIGEQCSRKCPTKRSEVFLIDIENLSKSEIEEKN